MIYIITEIQLISGSPILSLDKNRVIGIHNGAQKYDNEPYNLGKIILKYIIFKLNDLSKLTPELNYISINIKPYKSGGIYIGELKNVHKEGKGVLYYNDGSIYAGDWKILKKKETENIIKIIKLYMKEVLKIILKKVKRYISIYRGYRKKGKKKKRKRDIKNFKK